MEFYRVIFFSNQNSLKILQDLSLKAVVAEAGLVVSAGDAQALEAAIRRMFDDESLRAEYSARGLKRVEQHFDALTPYPRELRVRRLPARRVAVYCYDAVRALCAQASHCGRDPRSSTADDCPGVVRPKTAQGEYGRRLARSTAT